VNLSSLQPVDAWDPAVHVRPSDDADPTLLSDADWCESTTLCLLGLDPSLGGSEVLDLSERLCRRPRWRALTPGAAARKAYTDPDAAEGI